MRWLPYTLLALTLGAVLAFPSQANAASVSLDGDWNFLADPTASLDVQKLASAENVRPTTIPSSWQTQFTDLRDYAGVAWYWRSVTLNAPTKNQIVVLRFGAVDYLAEVFVNGQKAGKHEGGYLPFELDITSLCHPGENQIAVRVVDPGAKPSVVEGTNYAEIPHGKQNWYVQTSGLWQSVAIDYRPRMRLGAVHISASADGNFKIDAPVIDLPSGGDLQKPAYIGAEILDRDSKILWKESHEVVEGQTRYEFLGHLAGADLWSLASPSLYTLHVWLSSTDSQNYRFGFRTFEIRDGKFYLNGQPIFLRGALDQDFYPETVYTPPSLDYIKDEMKQAKKLGLNLLRCHIKVPDRRYLEAADQTGLLVWYEIPNWDKLTDNAKRRAAETLRGMVERDWNHPSIVIVSLINESWGVDMRESADRLWLKQFYEDAKKIVPGWLVVDNSACCENFHMESDIADYHEYASVPDYASNFDRIVEDQARRPGWLFSQYGDGAPKGNEPLMVSEFGNWGLPQVPEEKPWWFSRDFNGQEITKPEGFEQRFTEYQFESLFPNLKALVDATEWHEFASLKYEIGSIRLHPEMQGYVITEFTDINWESNGLLDMWRHPKGFADSLAKLQQADLLILRTEKRNFFAGEKVHLEAHFSHYGGENLPNPSVTWRLEGTPLVGSIAPPEIGPTTAVKLGDIDFEAPAPSAPEKRLLKATLVSGGQPIAEDSIELFFYPIKHPELPPPVSFHDPEGRLRRLVNEMHAHNYLEPTGAEALPVLISSVFDDQVKKDLMAGGRVVLIAASKQTLAPGIDILPRSGSELDGNWISNFLWIRKGKPPFTSLGFDTMTGFETQAITPAAVVKGIPGKNFNDVLAGGFYGWVHSNVGTLVQARYGKGKILICTFSLATTYGTDPFATYLLDAMISYIVSGPTASFEIPSSTP